MYIAGYCLHFSFKYVYLSVGVSKLQVAILARSSREMYQTVHIDWQYILSWVRVSIRPSTFFISEIHTKPRENRVASACVYLNDPADQAKRGVNSVTLRRHRPIEPERRRRCVCVCVCVCVRARLCARACARKCVRADNDINLNYYPICHTNQTHWWFPLNEDTASAT